MQRSLICAVLALVLLAGVLPARADDPWGRIATVGGSYFLGREAGSRIRHDRSSQLLGGILAAGAAYALTQPRSKANDRQYDRQYEDSDQYRQENSGYRQGSGYQYQYQQPTYAEPPACYRRTEPAQYPHPVQRRVIRRTETTVTTTTTVIEPDGSCSTSSYSYSR